MASVSETPGPPIDAREAIGQVRSWYHSIEVAPGIVTPGTFDLRPIVDRLPWPEVKGRRCLDVGTYDGFFAFELERRGAAEVVAIDLARHEDWDWEFELTQLGPEYMRAVAGPEVGAGVRVARELLGSSIELQQVSIYDLSPKSVGEFEVVLCGSLLLHLREPLRALAAIRSVCQGEFLCTNQIELLATLVAPRRPLFRLDGTSRLNQWWLPNRAGNRQLLRAAGFDIVAESGLYSIPYGPSHSPPAPHPKSFLRSVTRKIFTGNDGVAHHALLARPRQL